MRTSRATVFLGVLIGCALAGTARSADVKIDQVKLGTSIMGPKLEDGLKGKTVLIELWGIN